jgi:hypothetical protein
MHTERVTFLTTPDQKAALDAFAASNGMSVGHVVREATSRFISEPKDAADEEEALRLLAAELNEAAPRIQASLQRISNNIRELRNENDAFFRDQGLRK